MRGVRSPAPSRKRHGLGIGDLGFFGVEPSVLNEKGEEMQGACEGRVPQPVPEGGLTL